MKSPGIFTVLGHDLKSPLNAVESYLDIMRDRALGDALDPYMPILENAIARLHQMRELITDVVDWSRIQAPSPSRELITLDVSKTAHAVLDRFMEEARARGITITADIEEGLTIEAAAGDIDLALKHLIDNALHYNHDGGSISVAIQRAGPSITVVVADTGIGMTVEEQSCLFQEFVRIRNDKTR